MTGPSASRQVLLERIDTQRVGCELAGSPLYARVLDVVAADVARSGTFHRLLAPVADAPFGDAVLLRLLAGLHRLVLDGRVPELARHYPSAGGSRSRGLAGDVLRAAEAWEAELAVHLSEGVQTNEVGRSASLLGGYLELARAGRPLRVLEVGASAGLNLLFDRYRYTDASGAFGPVDSPLVFTRPWFGGAPDLASPLVVAERRGCDTDPIDVTLEQGRQRLRSFVWADQLDRLARLDAALEVAQVDPPAVDRADAAAWLDDQLEEPHADTCTVVAHSIMFQYLSEPGRAAMRASIEAAGARARPGAPLAWLRLEPGGDQAELRLTTWPGGTTNVLATSAYHGPPVVWLARRGEPARRSTS